MGGLELSTPGRGGEVSGTETAQRERGLGWGHTASCARGSTLATSWSSASGCNDPGPKNGAQRKCFPLPCLATCQTLCPMSFLPISPSNSNASFNTHFQTLTACALRFDQTLLDGNDLSLQVFPTRPGAP